MSRAPPVVLAVLLVLSFPAAGLQPSASATAVSSSVDGTSEPVRPTVNDTTAHMTFDADVSVQTSFAASSLALGNALAMDRSGMETQIDTFTLDERLASAERREQEKQVLNTYKYNIEQRIISLLARERTAIRNFKNGSLSTRGYVRTLARLDAEAADVREAIDKLETRADRIPKFSMEQEAWSLKADLVVLEGPVRDRVASSLQGIAPPTRVYVASTDTGVVLSAIVDGEYVREALRSDYRNPSEQDRLTLPGAKELVLDQYPWAAANRITTNTDGRYGKNVYRVTILHSHGKLTAYVDGGTERVFREYQRKNLLGIDSVPTAEAVTNATDGANLLVNRTYAGGPLRIRLVNETGAPLDGTVAVDGRTVGATGDDGVLWTVAPGERFTVSATRGSTTINATVTPNRSWKR